MKIIACVLLLFVLEAQRAQASLKCATPPADIPLEWAYMRDACVDGMRQQIQTEISASFQYLAMGAHFARGTIQRPGFAAHFFKAAREERDHGMQLMQYLSMRGQLTDNISDLIVEPPVQTQGYENGVAALQTALELEMKVTRSIRQLIETCDSTGSRRRGDDHLIDYLTSVYLEEQLQGQRALAEKLVTLQKILNSHGELGEFLFDQSL